MIINIIYIAIFSAFLSYTINFCMQTGMILNNWRIFVLKYLKPIIGQWVSILGICVFCTNIWIAEIFWCILYFNYSVDFFVGFFFCPAAANIFLLLINKYFSDNE